MEMILLFLTGIVGGTIGSLLGLGGGVIIVPALLFLNYLPQIELAISPQMAVGTSLIIIIVTAVSSTIAYRKQKRIDYRSAFLFFLGSGPGALVGALLNQKINIQQFYLSFGIILIVIFLLMTLKKRHPGKTNQVQVRHKIKKTFVDDFGEEHEYGYSLPLALGVSFVVGAMSGLFGIGGGALMVPTMLYIFRFPPHVAVATSMLIILLSSSVGAGTHILLGNVIWSYALMLAPGAWLGGKLGPIITRRLSSVAVVNCFKVVFLIIAIRMVLKGGGIG